MSGGRAIVPTGIVSYNEQRRQAWECWCGLLSPDFPIFLEIFNTRDGAIGFCDECGVNSEYNAFILVNGHSWQCIFQFHFVKSVRVQHSSQIIPHTTAMAVSAFLRCIYLFSHISPPAVQSAVLPNQDNAVIPRRRTRTHAKVHAPYETTRRTRATGRRNVPSRVEYDIEPLRGE